MSSCTCSCPITRRVQTDGPLGFISQGTFFCACHSLIMADYTAGIDSFCRYVMRVRYPTEEYLDSIYKFIFQSYPERAESFRNYTDWLRDNPKEYPYLCSLNSLSTQVDTTSRLTSPFHRVSKPSIALYARMERFCPHAERTNPDPLG